ncbi:rhodanese-like domain-containing protein [Aquimarina pacifica]|uniref:rhodanese-like domain-containing protein n=1 Tax=Aquimarina pacifica TaxID=1296415 RepID=UPI0004704A8D|nr:rhodanese-like domain-containing protein [Aquimarina pacifica]
MKNHMKTIFFILISIPVMSQEKKKLPNSKVDFDSFLEISEEIKEYRKDRLIALDTFLSYLKDEHTILLDTRSKEAYKKKHIKGAIHINFSDFTQEKLLKKLGPKTTRILIYCNNNIDKDPINFATKKIELALNIPTFINLYGYGYKNVYELSSLVSAKNKKLQFEGSDIR